jgi:arylsulfatase A-like enzyme
MNEKRPNVIWVMSDQQRAMLLSCNGDPNVSTPNIDTLADLGVNFARAVGGYPLCCPFRGSMLTSRYPHKCVPGHEYRLPPEMPTIADVFNENGYDTAYFGKWHLDGFHEKDGRAAMHIVPPERRGHFKKWVGYENNNSQYDCWVHGGEGASAFHYRLPGYETDCLTDLLLSYLDARREEDQPFFAVLSVQPPHNPYIAPPRFMDRHNPAKMALRKNVPDIPEVQERARREYAGACAMVEDMDWNVGRIRQKLEETGLMENTHVLYFSDHGDMHGSQGLFLKTNPYEESIRVPFILGGGRTHYGVSSSRRVDYPINHVDIAPTTLGLCGIPAPKWMEGTDYSAVRLGGALPEVPDSAYLQNVVPTRHENSTEFAWRGVVTRDGWKYVCFENMPWLMFNLNDDPFEQRNMAHNSLYRDKRHELNSRLKRWVEETGDDFPLPQM